jgi:hypothetical protein
MRLIIYLITFLIVGCQNNSHSTSCVKLTETAVIPGKMELIPTKVKVYLNDNLVGWNIPDTSDYIKCWWSFYERNQIPYFVTTDINDDNLADYAFILKNAHTIRLVILISTGNTFRQLIPDDFVVTFKDKVKDIQFGVNIEPPGLTDCIVDNKECSITLRSNSIVLMELERKSKYYYWQNGTIKMFRLR